MRAVPKKAKPERGPAATLLLLLAGFLVLAGLPDDRGSIRVAGVSLLWWYGAVLAPGLAVLAAVLRAPRAPGPSAPAPNSTDPGR